MSEAAPSITAPEPGSAAELAIFWDLQSRLPDLFRKVLVLLKLPRTRIIYVTSQPVSEEIIDYYLHLLPGIPATHARQRLTLFSCFDSTPKPLAKILARPRLLARLRDAIPETATAHMSCFNVSVLERTLAAQLGSRSMAAIQRCSRLDRKAGGGRSFARPGCRCRLALRTSRMRAGSSPPSPN